MTSKEIRDRLSVRDWMGYKTSDGGEVIGKEIDKWLVRTPGNRSDSLYTNENLLYDIGQHAANTLDSVQRDLKIEQDDNKQLRQEVDVLHKMIERTYDAVFPTGNNLMGYATKLYMIARQVQKLYKGPSMEKLIDRATRHFPPMDAAKRETWYRNLMGYQAVLGLMSQGELFPYWEESSEDIHDPE